MRQRHALLGALCLLGLVGCGSGADPAGDTESETELAAGAQAVTLPPTLPPPPQGATCVLLQRGTLGTVGDTDVGFGNGTWAAGAYPFTWTGSSPLDHWSVYRFDLAPIPAGSQIVLAAFTNYVSWNEQSSTVRAHRILNPWSEATTTAQSFGGTANWDPAVVASFDPIGVGYKTIDVTALAQGWFAGQFPNAGLLLEEDASKLHNYLASEASDVTRRPSLYVCFASGGPCGGKANGDACNDGNACTLGEACLNGQCVGGVPKSCDALDACHDAGICNPATGVCSDLPKPDGSPCTDGDACTGPDACLAGACSGADVSCNDGNACNGVESCNTATGCVAGTDLDCNDQSACTADVCDPQSGCGHTAVSCDDSNVCTGDTCDPQTGCGHTAVSCDDSNACTGDTCDPQTGCGHAAVSCDDNNACTNDGCDPQMGCVHLAVSCDDSNACTTDTCDPQGGCGHAAVSCDDGNACTSDTCNPQTGCAHAAVNCNDSVACTVDSCAGGNCKHQIQCPPGQPCSQSFCSSAQAQDPQFAWLCQ